MWTIVTPVYIIIIVAIIIVIILENRNSVKTVSWILVLALLPGLGLILYMFFGQNFRRKRIISNKSFKKIETQIHQSYKPDLVVPQSFEHQRIAKLLYRNNRSNFYTNNQLKVLPGGKEAFEHIRLAIESARHYIHLEYYIIEDDEVGNVLKDLLIQKTREGIKVRLIFDDVGSWHLRRCFLRELKQAGVEYYSFFRVRFPYFTSKINYRNHRKIVIVDGKVGFTGGVNISSRYINGHNGKGWRDLHLRIEGDAVKGLQTVFLADWYFVSQKNLTDTIYFPSMPPVGNQPLQIASSGPDTNWRSIMQGIFWAITNAKEFVYITTPYLMPPESILNALQTAAMSGVDVRIITPDNSDAFITLECSKSYIKELLEAGVKVYLYAAGFLHSKLMVTDQIASVGTANLDFRSFEENFEVTAFIYDANTITELRDVFFEDVDNSHEMNLSKWRKRSLWKKFKESVARLFSPLL